MREKYLPAVSIPCSMPPISLSQLPGIFHHEPILKSLNRFIGRRISDNPAIACLDFATILFSGAGFEPCVQPPAILEDRLDCFLVWVFITDQSGIGGPTSNYATASIAP